MIAAFGVIAMLSSANEVRDADNLADLRGLFWTRPALASVMTLVLLSLAGIPPAIGFIAKMYIMAAGVHTQLWGLTAVMVASSVIGLFYYLNILLAMTLKPGEGAPLPAVPLRNRLGMALVGLPVLGFGIAPEPLMALLRAVFG
jgi:NADH-quinone oxidoreductase subunit N